MLKWKRFAFFEEELVRGEGAEIIKSKNIQASTSGYGFIMFGDNEGFVHIFNRRFEHHSFKAFSSQVTFLRMLEHLNVLVSVGDDGSKNNRSSVHFWNMDHLDEAGVPDKYLVFKLFDQDELPEDDVHVHVVSDDLDLMAFGLEEGKVVLLQGDMSRRDRKLRRVILPTPNGDAVLDMKLLKMPDWSYLLYCSGRRSMFAYRISSGGIKEIPMGVHAPEEGTALKPLVTFPPDSFSRVRGTTTGCGLGKRDGIFFAAVDSMNNVEDRGCSLCECEKFSMYWIRNFLVVVSDDPTLSESESSSSAGPSSDQLLNIFDLEASMICYRMSVKEVVQIVYEYGYIYVLVKESMGEDATVQKLYRLKEKETQKKLESLFRKNQYEAALKLAEMQGLDEDYIMYIHKVYGDHLCSKGQFDIGMTQYKKTIGNLEPSYVIRKYLENQKIEDLITYLQELHNLDRATVEHTTLLLNCYIKLKKIKELHDFLMLHENYDVETAISVLRQDYQNFQNLEDRGSEEARQRVALASEMARKHKKTFWVLKIEIEDNQNYEEALDFLSRLPFEEVEKNMKLYGKTLVTNAPAASTELLKRLCDGFEEEVDSLAFDSVESTSSFEDSPTVSEASSSDLASSSVDAFRSRLQSRQRGATPSKGGAASQSSRHAVRTVRLKSRPEDFINLFVDAPYYLMEFLEYILSRHGSEETLLYDTLLELYLREEPMLPVGGEMSPENRDSIYAREKAIRRKKALDMLNSRDDKLNKENALVLVQARGLKEGILLLYEKLFMYYEIMQYHMEQKEYRELIRACHKFGSNQPGLWMQVLSFFASITDEDLSAEIKDVLAHIEKDDLISPLDVIEILSRNSNIRLSSVKEHTSKKLADEQDKIEEFQRSAEKLQEETESMRKNIVELRTSAKIFQHQKCSSCKGNLELPSVHFLCMHSFHERCLGENEKECPECMTSNKKFRDIKKNLEESAEKHDTFMKALVDANKEGFGVVAEYFGRGIFNRPTMQNYHSTTSAMASYSEDKSNPFANWRS